MLFAECSSRSSSVSNAFSCSLLFIHSFLMGYSAFSAPTITWDTIDEAQCPHTRLMNEFSPSYPDVACGVCALCYTLVVGKRGAKTAFRPLASGSDDSIAMRWFVRIRYDHSYHGARLAGTTMNMERYGVYLENKRDKKSSAVQCARCASPNWRFDEKDTQMVDIS